MRYYQFELSGDRYLAVETDSGVYNFTEMYPKVRSFGDLLGVAEVADTSVDDLVEPSLTEEVRMNPDIPGTIRSPVDAQEIWAAGVTYEISEEAREVESDTPDIYMNVYDADRPEIFLKATSSRTVGPNEAVGIRSDSNWDIPEPELGIVLHEGEVVGYTIGNDMSSRSIEGENPLYLPQAKTYKRCCAIGPCVATPGVIDDPHDLTLHMSITREDDTLYEEQTSTGNMIRSCEELVSYFRQSNAVPELSVLLTGTSLVPEDDLTLHEGDRITIEIEDIGTLSNVVTSV